MATISRGLLDDFVLGRMALTKSCKSLAKEILKSYDGDPDDYDALFNHCFAMLDKICLAATDVAAVIEGELYQLVYEYSNKEEFRPVFRSGYTSKSVEESLHAFITSYSSSKDIDALSGKMAQRVGMEIDHAIAHCAIENERLDNKKKKWARVPSSPAPCKTCCMLASRGFVYTSYETARGKVGSHYGECKCTIMQGYAGADVEGYDKDAFYRQWQKLEEIDKREDLSQDEKDVLRLVAADSEQKFNLEQSKELVANLDRIINARAAVYRGVPRDERTQDLYEETIGSMLSDIGNLYGMRLTGGYAEGWSVINPKMIVESAIPNGEEIWAATRMRKIFTDIHFPHIDRGIKKGNPDLLADGEYIDIKTPVSRKKISSRINDAFYQCINRGQNHGVVILSMLNLPDERALFEQVILDRISKGWITKAYLILPNSMVVEF